MRAVLAALIVCLFAFAIPAPASAQARHDGHHARHWRAHHHHWHHSHRARQHHLAHRASSAVFVRAEPDLLQSFFGAGGQTAQRVGRSLADRIASLYDQVTAAALRYGVPINIAQAIIKHESDYNPRARGTHGEIGLGQVLPGTAVAMGEDPYTVDGNLAAAMKYAHLALAASGDLCAAISLYNRGIRRPPRCTAYGRAIMRLAGL